MANNTSFGHDERSARQHAQRSESESQANHGLDAACISSESVTYPSTLINDSRLEVRGNAPVRSSVMQNMQQTHGNRAVQRFIQRISDVGQSDETEKKTVQRSFLDAIVGELPSLGGIGQSIAGLGGSAARGISNLGHSAGGIGRDIYSGIGGGISSNSSWAGNEISSLGNDIFGKGSAFGDIAGIAGGAVSGIGSRFGGALSSGGGNLMSRGESLVDRVAGGVSEGASNIGGDIASLGDLPPEAWQM